VGIDHTSYQISQAIFRKNNDLSQKYQAHKIHNIVKDILNEKRDEFIKKRKELKDKIIDYMIAKLSENEDYLLSNTGVKKNM
jgi:hypothetical protein